MLTGVSPTSFASRGFPEYGMSSSEQERLRQMGIVVIPFMDSLHEDPRRLKPHYHGFFQMFLIHGEAHVMHDFREYDAKGATLVFLSPGQVHTANPEPGLYGTTISFTQAFFDGAEPPPSRLMDFPFFFPAEAQPWLSLKIPRDNQILESFAALKTDFDADLPGAEDVLRAMLRILFVQVNRVYAKARPQATPARADMLVRAFHLAVEKHFREFQNLPEYARLLDVSENHLNDVVREQTGSSAGEIIRRRRLLDAKRLLSHSDLTVSEIGYQLGFKDPSYFSRFFTRLANESPAAFRDKIREKYQGKPG